MLSFIRGYYFTYFMFFIALLLPYFKPEIISSKTRVVAWIAGLLFASPFVIFPIYVHFFRKPSPNNK